MIRQFGADAFNSMRPGRVQAGAGADPNHQFFDRFKRNKPEADKKEIIGRRICPISLYICNTSLLICIGDIAICTVWIVIYAYPTPPTKTYPIYAHKTVTY
jgi:hypothetical protein